MTLSLARGMTRRALITLLRTAVAAVVAASCTSARVGEGLAVAEVSGQMPPLSGTALEGGSVGTAMYRGRPVVVNFWATWCGPCRREQPALSSVQRAAGPDGPVFIGVNYRDDRAAARAYLREFDVDYPSVEDASGSLAWRFDVPYLPATIFVDASGQMRYRAVGALDERRLRQLIARIAPKAGASPGAAVP